MARLLWLLQSALHSSQRWFGEKLISFRSAEIYWHCNNAPRYSTYVSYAQTSAPKSPRGRTSSPFYTHRVRSSTMFVKNSVKMHSVASKLLKKKVNVAFFQTSIIHSKKYNNRIHEYQSKKWFRFLVEYLPC